MKRFVFLLLTFLLIPQLALASRSQELKVLIDEFTFFQTVEWDQKDVDLYTEKQNELLKGIQLQVEKGLTRAEILEAAGSESLNLQTFSSSQEVLQFMKSNTAYKQGASWNGDASAAIVGVSVIAAFVGILSVLIIKENKKFDRCVESNNGNEESCIDRGL